MKVRIIMAISCLHLMLNTQAQTRTYVSGSSEMIFSFGKIISNGNEMSSELRWSPVFNGEGLMNHDFTQHMGIFYGLAYRNVGFIYKPTADTLKKFRTYNLGIPVGIKLGNLDGTFLYGGYEFEMPFNYKEKTFIDEVKKEVFDVWFTDRVNWYTQSVFFGINFKGGTNLKFKYYIDPFFNRNFSQTVAGVATKPFEKLEVNVFYIALSWNVFKDVKSYNKSRFNKQAEHVPTAL
ncbi:MAG: hypothetical protein WC760_06905 [Bacteroidia bacterium]